MIIVKLNCIVIDDEPHAIAELVELIEGTPEIVVLKCFEDAYTALAYLKMNGAVDVVFSDISMPGLNGLDAAKTMSAYCEFLVFVTAHKEFAVDAFGVNATGYLVKPVSNKAFIEQVETLISKKIHHDKLKNDHNDVLFLKGSQKNSFIKIRYNDIIYIEALLNYVVVHTTKGKEITYLGLKGMEEKLKNKDVFFRVAKSAIISINFLDRVEGNIVRLTDKNFFLIGEKYRSAFHDFLRKRTLNS
ncbi:MAG: response regulator transcription factor [Flavobacterium sp.]|nr:MAG: response regulator transcription factor [Flavobacterium sp.]